MNNVSKPLRKLCPPMTRIDEITFIICINNKFLTVFEFESDFAMAIHIKELRNIKSISKVVLRNP
jgi:hypothetical protein